MDMGIRFRFSQLFHSENAPLQNNAYGRCKIYPQRRKRSHDDRKMTRPFESHARIGAVGNM